MNNNLQCTVRRLPIAVSAVGMMLALGSIYAWSIFKLPLMRAHGWTGPETGFAFTLAILFVGIATALGGGLVDKAGSRKIAVFASILFACGTLLSGLADTLGSKHLLWLGYGIIGGAGNGLCYITCIAVLLRWFPGKKGLISGLGVMGFALGAAVLGKIGPFLILKFGVAKTFYILGALFIVVLPLLALNLENPVNEPCADNKTVSGMTINEALKIRQFYLMWFILFLNVVAGVAVMSNLSPMAQMQAGISAVSAGILISAVSLFNAFGRIFWAALSDKIGGKIVFMLMLGTQSFVMAFLPSVSNTWIFSAMCCYILFCYGGGFGTMPSFASEAFGAGNIGRIYGAMLLSLGLGGIVGPMLMEFAGKFYGNFSAAIYTAGVLQITGFSLAFFYRKPQIKIALPS